MKWIIERIKTISRALLEWTGSRPSGLRGKSLASSPKASSATDLLSESGKSLRRTRLQGYSNGLRQDHLTLFSRSDVTKTVT